MTPRALLRSASSLLLAGLAGTVFAQSGTPEATPPAAPKAAPPKAARPAAVPVARVNGVAIPRLRADVLARERTSQGAPDSVELRAAVREDLINREVVAQEAARAGFTKRSDFQAELELIRQTVIVQHYLRDWVRRNPISDAEIQGEYDRAKQQAGDKEYRARHILVESEAEAKSLIAELKKGGSFEDLAQKNSKDTGNKSSGGDLGWHVPAVFDKAFSDAMMKLDKGQMTDAPVQTRFGYHVIRLDDVRALKFPPLSELKPRIQQQIAQRKVDAHVRALRDKARVE